MEFVREVKLGQLEGVVDETYPHCLEQIIMLMNAMSRDPTQTKALREAVQLFREVYANPPVEHYVQALAADLYELLGRHSLNCGHLTDFIHHMFLSHVMEHLHQKKARRDGLLDRDLARVLGSLKEHLESKMGSADHDTQGQVANIIALLFGSMSGLCNVLLVLGDVHRQSRVQSLTEHSYNTFLKYYQKHIALLKLVLELTSRNAQ